MYLLVTGGLGFIGSHVVVKLINLDYKIVVYDNLSNSDIVMIDKINKITNKIDNLIFIEGDIRDKNKLNDIFNTYDFLHVFHFAALKSVSESEIYPKLYKDVNVNGTLALLDVMNKFNCKNFVYSSSATVYGDTVMPTTEESLVGNNLSCNYAHNKYDVEQYLINEHNKEGILKDWNIIILRYFNPIGAHPSGIIGEDPNGIPNNVFPYLLRVAKWTNETSLHKDLNSPYKIFTIFGNNYDTHDGTCIRDYIHIEDLSQAHVDVIKVLNNSQLIIYNVGTGNGTTVMELVKSINRILVKNNRKEINYRIGERRKGDIDISYAKVNKIYKDIGFKTKYTINDMCKDGLNFIGLL